MSNQRNHQPTTNGRPRHKHLALTFEHTVEFSNNTRAPNPPARASLGLYRCTAFLRFLLYPSVSGGAKFAPQSHSGPTNVQFWCD